MSNFYNESRGVVCTCFGPKYPEGCQIGTITFAIIQWKVRYPSTYATLHKLPRPNNCGKGYRCYLDSNTVRRDQHTQDVHEPESPREFPSNHGT